MPIAFQQLVKTISAESSSGRLTVIEEKFWRVKREWEKFVTGGGNQDLDIAVIPESVGKDWVRLQAAGLNPYRRAAPPLEIWPDPRLKRLLSHHQDLIGVSRPFLDFLHACVKDCGFAVSLFNERGFILDVRRDDRYLALHGFSRWTPGVRWTKKTAGNNIISSVLDEKKACRLFGPQHYLEIYQYVTTSGAPIFDPDGALTGGIAISSHLYASNDHTLNMVEAAALAIGDGLRTQQTLSQCQKACLQTDTALSLQKSIFEAIPSALIVLDNRGYVLQLNEAAQKKFSFGRKDVRGVHLADLCPGKANITFLRLVHSHSFLSNQEIQIASFNTLMDCLLDIKPLISSTGKTLGKILIFSDIKRPILSSPSCSSHPAHFRFEDICGTDQRFLAAVEQARSVSRSDTNVLLLGQSGTGKDVLAQAIHNAGSRKNGPYIAINCGAIPRNLIVSELFGHTEGSFTGSKRGGHEGKFKLAHRGTLFLDEIGEMPLELQSALLRVIEDRCFLAIGGTRMQSVDVRIISATNKNLQEEVRKGRFREDLYYRLNVFSICLPPLAQRRDDILPLAHHFMKKCSDALGRRVTEIDRKVMETFLTYPWPGNVRELQNVIERMILMARGPRLTIDLIPGDLLHPAQKNPLDRVQSVQDFERHLLSQMIDCKWSKSEMARRMKITRATLYRKLYRHGFHSPGGIR
jgi:transcriptional regulator with PAS, ATPase and Fis domain